MDVAVAPRVLLVEDDRELVSLLVRLLTAEGYAVEHAGDGQRALHLLLTGRHDVVVLDRGLPVADGLSVLAAARARGITTPALVLSARGGTLDRVTGLDGGAQDYLSKPFDVEELLARLRALRRRHLDGASSLRLGDATLDLGTRTVRRGGAPQGSEGAGADGEQAQLIALSQREAALLGVLAARPRKVFTREELRERVFDAATSDSVVDTYVHYCRAKLGPAVIRTVRGVGYRLGAG